MKEQSNSIDPPDWIDVLDILYDADVLVTNSKIQADREIEEREDKHLRTGEYYIFQGGGDASEKISNVNQSIRSIELELERLADLGLVKLIDFQDAPSKKKYRLTDEGLQIVYDLRFAKKEEEWEEQRQEWREKQQYLQSSVKNINTTLAAATIILAGSAIVQSLDFMSNPLQFWITALTIIFAFIFYISRT
jgi:DNA-binding PadR family transcriptional regulator